MNRKLCVFSYIIVIMILLFPVSSRGDENWDESLYRCADSTGLISDAEMLRIDQLCKDLIKQYQIDLVMISVKSSSYHSTLSQSASEYYEDSGFGWGENRDGLVCAYDIETGEIVLIPFGRAEEIFDEGLRTNITECATAYLEKQGIFGVLYSVEHRVSLKLEKYYESDVAEITGDSQDNIQGKTGSEKETVDEAGDQTDENTVKDIPRFGVNADKPYWYPLNTEDFTFYHDDQASRVVDVADIFTDEEEDKMQSLIADIRNDCNKDVVIFTDISTYGLDKSVYAADFYDFNGYGLGDEYEGVCLMICMDPKSRGWWCCASGSESLGLYNQKNATELDDVLYGYMSAGNYGAGVIDWISNIRRLYTTGKPFSPFWIPEDKDGFIHTNNAAASRVVDLCSVLTEAEKKELESRINHFSQKYNMDLAVVITDSLNDLSGDEYAEEFYYYGGYGFGDEFDGYALVLDKKTLSSYVYAQGKGMKYLNKINRKRITRQCNTKTMINSYSGSVQRGITDIAHMVKYGRVQFTFGAWLLWIVFSLTLGGAVSSQLTKRLLEKMKTIRRAVNADIYLVKESYMVIASYDYFMYTESTTHYRPTTTTSTTTSSSSGNSKYKSNYSGSSGRSHSGSGRSF